MKMDQKRCPPFLTCPYNRCLSHYADKRFNGVGQQRTSLSCHVHIQYTTIQSLYSRLRKVFVFLQGLDKTPVTHGSSSLPDSMRVSTIFWQNRFVFLLKNHKKRSSWFEVLWNFIHSTRGAIGQCPIIHCCLFPNFRDLNYFLYIDYTLQPFPIFYRHQLFFIDLGTWCVTSAIYPKTLFLILT